MSEGTSSVRGDSSSAPEIAIVVLSYGHGQEATTLLRYMGADAISTGWELLVVHNPSSSAITFETPEGSSIRALNLPTNRGYVGGMNVGIAQAMQHRPEFILLLTHDVRLTARDIEALQILMRQYPDLGAIGPVLCGPDNVPYSAGFSRRGRVRTQHRTPKDVMPRPLWPCDALDGAVMMWRRSALEDVEGFDERFFMYFDDVDICARASRFGWQIAVASDLSAISAQGGGNRRSAHAYLRARNGLAYARSFGLAGLFAGLRECTIGLWNETPKPGGRRFRDPAMRRLAVTYWHSTLLGVFDYFRGHWGPPPNHVLRNTDIASTSA